MTFVLIFLMCLFMPDVVTRLLGLVIVLALGTVVLLAGMGLASNPAAIVPLLLIGSWVFLCLFVTSKIQVAGTK